MDKNATILLCIARAPLRKAVSLSKVLLDYYMDLFVRIPRDRLLSSCARWDHDLGFALQAPYLAAEQVLAK